MSEDPEAKAKSFLDEFAMHGLLGTGYVRVSASSDLPILCFFGHLPSLHFCFSNLFYHNLLSFHLQTATLPHTLLWLPFIRMCWLSKACRPSAHCTSHADCNQHCV